MIFRMPTIAPTMKADAELQQLIKAYQTMTGAAKKLLVMQAEVLQEKHPINQHLYLVVGSVPNPAPTQRQPLNGFNSTVN